MTRLTCVLIGMVIGCAIGAIVVGVYLGANQKPGLVQQPQQQKQHPWHLTTAAARQKLYLADTGAFGGRPAVSNRG